MPQKSSALNDVQWCIAEQNFAAHVAMMGRETTSLEWAIECQWYSKLFYSYARESLEKIQRSANPLNP